MTLSKKKNPDKILIENGAKNEERKIRDDISGWLHSVEACKATKGC